MRGAYGGLAEGRLWAKNSVSHNMVVVNERRQYPHRVENPHLFGDDGMVRRGTTTAGTLCTGFRVSTSMGVGSSWTWEIRCPQLVSESKPSSSRVRIHVNPWYVGTHPDGCDVAGEFEWSW